MKVIHENEAPEKAVPGRFLRWIAGRQSSLTSNDCACCIMRVEPGSTVQPAHSHPDCEELIYFIEGDGHVYVDGLISPVKAGSAVLFEKNSIHMVRNSGKKEMKVACFFSAATDLGKYEFHEDVDFDKGTFL
jgi:uncharacterized cupin superfamily protein